MSCNLLEVIQNSLHQNCKPNIDENYNEYTTLTEFIDHIQSNYKPKQANLLIDIIRAYLQDKFSINIILENDNVTNIFISGPSNKMLLEPNFLFRFIEYLPEIIQMIDAIEGPVNRLNGLRILMKAFENRNLFRFLNFADIDDTDKICLITILHFYMKGIMCPSIMEVCKFLPKSNYLQFINRLENNSSGLIQQDLIKLIPENYRLEMSIKLQSRAIALMCNESISLI
jgi:hypothetical protein